jgi:hypothetical protein
MSEPQRRLTVVVELTDIPDASVETRCDVP